MQAPVLVLSKFLDRFLLHFLASTCLSLFSPLVLSVTKRSERLGNTRNDSLFFVHSYHMPEIRMMFFELRLIGFSLLFISNVSI